MKKPLILTTLLVLISSFLLFAQEGTIRGVVTDAKSGEPLMFASVVVKDSNPLKGTQTDLDGNYELVLAPGTYSLEFSYTGYLVKTVTDVEVKAGAITSVDLLMEEAAEVLDEVVVTSARIDRTENALLALQRKATTIQDGISSQEISRYGSSNAAESMKRVTGASVVDGRYVVVRGLGDRYSAAQLNGLPMPSTDPYRNSTQLDLIPANLMENVIASKTFTPNQPGNFTGGNVDIRTKSFPERFTMSFSVSSSYNDQASFNDRFLSYEGGKTDWLGYDDGSRKMPAILSDQKVRDEMTPSLATRGRRNAELANLLDQTSKSFNSQMAPTAGQSTTNYGVSFSIGNQYSVFKNPLGFLLGVSYSRNLQHFEDGVFRNFALLDPNAPELNEDRNLTETRSTINPQLGGLLGVAYKFARSQKIAFNALYNHDTEIDSRYLVGPFPAILSSGEFETRSISFKEREIQNYQFVGEHVIGHKGFRIDWSAGYVNSTQDEPDLRFFANSIFTRDNGGAEKDTSYFITPNEYPLPFHFFRSLQDEQWQGKIDFTIPFAQGKSKANKIEFGALYQTKDRSFLEDRFQYQIPSTATRYAGDPAAFFASSNTGILGQNPTNNQYLFGLFLADVTIPANSYSGTEEIAAAYGMITYDLSKLKIIAGARLEQTNIEVVSADETKPSGKIDQLDVLPSVNLIYRLREDMNLRASASQTLARPNMRELAPFSSFDFIGDFLYTGNPDIKRTLAQNYDLRWELYPSAGELFAVSAYFKNFRNPIVLEFVAEAANKDEVQFNNVDNAVVYGAEFELRKNLGFLGAWLNNFKFTTNFSLIKSVVDIPADEQQNIDQFYPAKGNTRPFQGQSPFLLNAGLNYVNPEAGIDAIVSLNVFGRRLDAISFGARPDIFEEARPQLDFSFRKSFNERFGLKISATNILNPAYQKTMDYKDLQFIIQQYRRGRNFGVSLSYTI